MARLKNWGLRHRKRVRPAPAECSGSPEQNDWDFLRDQADHDADEMASVERLKEAAPPSRAGGTRRVGAPRRREQRTPEALLLLEVRVRSSVRPFHVGSCALIGRRDEESGARPDLDLREDDAVSRRHAWIFRRDDRFYLRDLDSTNGTEVNGRRLEPEEFVPLYSGDEIRLGECVAIHVAGVERATGVPPSTSATLAPVPDPLAVLPSLRPVSDVLELALAEGAAAGLLDEAPGEERASAGCLGEAG
jgi:hypothetical protein